MKKIVMMGLCLATGVAFANGNGNGNGNGNSNGNGHSGDPTIQATVLVNTAVVNSAFGRSGSAQQNLASNVGSFDNNVTKIQYVNAKNSLIKNEAFNGTAQQNISSNVGEDGITTSTYQMTFIRDSAVMNKAGWGGKAVQNLSSNTNCITCQQ